MCAGARSACISVLQLFPIEHELIKILSLKIIKIIITRQVLLGIFFLMCATKQFLKLPM